MKKYRFSSVFQKALAALLCLSMALSVVPGMNLSELFDLTENVDAAEETTNPDEYKDETLYNMWDPDGDGDPKDDGYWTAARSYYTCAYNNETAAKNGTFAQFGGVYKRTIFHVYAFEGETICLGSSVCNSGINVDNKLKSELSAVSGSTGFNSETHFPDKDSCDIVMTDLKGNKIPIDIRNSEGDTTGYIASPGAEFAAVKMTMKPDGTFDAAYGDATYTPYTYKVKESGVYTFEFHSYDGTGVANPSGANEKRIGDQWPTAATNYIDNGSFNDAGGLIAALNITVFDEKCQKQTGRTYADFLSLQMAPTTTNNNVTERYYVLTTDSYIYKMQFNNASPYTYNFFSNNRGIFDNATGEIVYKSVKDIKNDNNFARMGSFFVYPGNKETEKDKSFYIFLEYPDDDLEGEIYQKAVQPDPATNVRFVGQVEINEEGEVKKVPGAYFNMGGYFAFDVKEATTATLRLDFNHIEKATSAASLNVPEAVLSAADSPTTNDEETTGSENITEDLTENFTEEPSASEKMKSADPMEESTVQGETVEEIAASAETMEIPTEADEAAENTEEPAESDESLEITEENTEEPAESDEGSEITEESAESDTSTSEITEEASETSGQNAPILNTPNSAQILQKASLEATDPDYVYAPVEISGVVKPNSTNYFYWDGCDGNGVPIPAGQYDLNDIVYTVTTKAGEIHFPIFDMECASGGITFTRLSHIYDKNGKRLDSDDNIYGMTKNIIYYDETAIYYGENVAVTGISEDQVDVAQKFFSGLSQEERGKKYYGYYNIKYNDASEYNAQRSSYIQSHPAIRVGDHSHTTNVIKYFSDADDAHILTKTEVDTDQQHMIDYLSTDTSHYPAGKANGTTGGSTTDYAIANYWTFIPAKPATAINNGDSLWIVDPPEDEELFKLVGRVFYDGGGTTGVYDDNGVDGEHLLSGVTLKLYKKTEDSECQVGKQYFNRDGEKMVDATAITDDTYELVDTGITRTDGSYVFMNLTYDLANGTEYLYQVIRPNSSYQVTSKGKTAKYTIGNDTAKTPYGYYSNHSYGENYKGTEIQCITVGGTGGVDPKHLMYKTNSSDDDNAINVDNSVCAVDVGYYYALQDRSLALKKEWNTTGSHPDAVVYEVSYRSQNSTTEIYGYHTLSAGGSWSSKDQFLPTNINGSVVEDYFVSSEYFIDGDYVYKYTFDYDKGKGKYGRFLGEMSRKSLADIFSAAGMEKPAVCSISSLPDLNNDGVSDGADLGNIVGWTPVDDAKTDGYRAVIDRNMLSDSNSITVTNAIQHGTIEIYKFHDEDDTEKKNALQGATFRLYKGDMKTTMQKISDNDEAWISANYIGSATSRANGHLTFTGLDPDQTYTVREMFAPDGFRILQEYYEVRPVKERVGKDEENVFRFDENHYASFTIGNAPADTSLKIRKRIVGRAWQEGDGSGAVEDAFTFRIACQYDSVNRDDSDIKENNDEYSILGMDTAKGISELSTFADNVNKKEKVKISNADAYYSYTVQDDATKTEVTYTSADTKMSNDLLTGSEETEKSAPKFLDIAFPMAGEYTFTITEDGPSSGDALNLEHSTYTYRVTVAVVRKLNSKEDDPDTTEMTAANTHLEAEVSNITYRESDADAFKTFSGSSPLFTNTYKTAPAEQKTSYKIVKNFIGREEWTESDKFTMEIRCADVETITAVKNGNLKISGFTSTAVPGIKELPDNGGWEYTFDKSNYKIPLKFKSFQFKDIEFPVQYVDSAGNAWKPSNPDQTTPTEEEIEADSLTPKTMPVTYTFKIKERLPEGITAGSNVHNGITYDTTEYTLTIVLNNTEKRIITGGSTGEEEEDGIIEEIDVTLSKGEEKSECMTRQGVMEEDAWLRANEEDHVTIDELGLTGSVKFYYIDSAGQLKERDDSPTAPADAKLFFWKWEYHSATSGFGDDGHTMTINNEYHTSYEWAPQIEKILQGRDWLTGDSFKFTITRTDGDDGAVTMPSTTFIDITDEDRKIEGLLTGQTGYSDRFGTIEFHSPGTYKFEIAETAPIGGGITVDGKTVTEKVYEIEVTVRDDAHDGNMTAVFNGGFGADTPIRVVNTYKDEELSFDFGISKTIKGRDWETGDSFSFTVTPADDTTKEAINKGIIVMPADETGTWETQSDGSYKATINYSDAGAADPIETISKEFGEIKIVSGSATKDTYQFKIQEDTAGLKEKHMKCLEDKITLVIHVEREADTGSLPTGKLLVTYSYMDGASDDQSVDEGVFVPFTNECRGQLTVAKKVTSKVRTEDFTFEVNFRFADGANTTDMTATHSIAGSTVTESDGKTKYSFQLKDGESVVFDDIPPDTTYTVTEKEIPKGYVLLRVRDHMADNGDKDLLSGDSNAVNGTITVTDAVQYRLFVNGLIQKLPSSGGVGVGRFIYFGSILTAGAAALLAVLYFKRRKRKELNES